MIIKHQQGYETKLNSVINTPYFFAGSYGLENKQLRIIRIDTTIPFKELLIELKREFKEVGFTIFKNNNEVELTESEVLGLIFDSYYTNYLNNKYLFILLHEPTNFQYRFSDDESIARYIDNANYYLTLFNYLD